MTKTCPQNGLEELVETTEPFYLYYNKAFKYLAKIYFDNILI